MTAGGDNVVFLKYRSREQEDGEFAMLACKCCRNKTFLHVVDRPGYYPLVKCAACGNHIGRLGWVHDEDPLVRSPDGESA